MALQFSAIDTGDGIGLHFTKVLDTVSRGLVDEDEEVAQVTDRGYWEKKASKLTLSLCDSVFEKCSDFLPVDSRLSYNKFYIGFWTEGRACNFTILRPQKNVLRIDIKLPKADEYQETIENAELDYLDYDPRWGNYRIRVSAEDLSSKGDTILSLMKTAFELRQ